MQPCPRCGTPNAADASSCGACGTPLALASTQKLGSPPAANRTLLGISPVAARAVPDTQPDAPILNAPTQPEQPAQAPAAAQAAPGPLDAKRTLLGIAPLGQVPAQASVPPQPSPAMPSQGKHTLLGLAPGDQAALNDAIARTQVGPSAASQPPAPNSVVASVSSAAAFPSQHKTKLGIAHPGIAPLDPGRSKAPPSAPAAPALAASQSAAAPAPLPPRRVPWLAFGALGAALVLIVVSLVVVFLWKSRGPLTARVQLDDSGREALAISCSECPDGTRVEGLGVGERAEFKSGMAELKLSKPLEVGSNELSLDLVYPSGKSQKTTLSVPVAYRLVGDLSELQENPPLLAVSVEARPDTLIAVGGDNVELDGGKGRYRVDVSRDLSGVSNQVVPLEKRIAYRVTLPDGKTESGQIKLQAPIVPLRIDAPGESVVIESPVFTLAGTTAKGASVSLSGKALNVDAAGRFAQPMNVSSVGETTVVVRASLKDHAPRLFPIRVKRVASLAEEAKHFEKRATKSYSGIASNPDGKRGWAVVLDGEVVEAREENHTSIILLEAKNECRRAPCYARLLYGGSSGLSKGNRVRAFGTVRGAVDGPRSGAKIPELSVDFFLKE